MDEKSTQIRLLFVFACLVAAMIGFSALAHGTTLSVVKPTVACAELLKIDFANLEDAPTKLDSAVVVNGSTSAPSQQCVVTGYVAPKFIVSMPTQNRTGAWR